MNRCTTHDSTNGCQGASPGRCAERGTCRVRADGWHQWACDLHAGAVEARYSPRLAAMLAAR